jgi:hypothetical protein
MMNQSRVVRSSGVGWIASLMKQLLEEVRIAPVGVATRARIAAIHDRSVNRLERDFARDVVVELEGIPVLFCGQLRLGTGLPVGQGYRISRLDKLLDVIETSQLGQQRRRQRKAHARRSRHTVTIAQDAGGGATRGTDNNAHDDPSSPHV